MTNGEAMKPGRRINRIAGPENGDPELDNREKSASNRVRVPGASVQLFAFDEQERRRRLIPDLANLVPKATAAERAVEVSDRLALDEHIAPDTVITGCQRLDLNACPKALQGRRNPAGALEHVCSNQRQRCRNDSGLSPDSHLRNLQRQQDDRPRTPILVSTE